MLFNTFLLMILVGWKCVRVGSRVILGRELVDLAKYFQCFGRDFVLAVSQRVTGDLDQMRVGAAEAAADVGQGRKAINGQDDFRGGDVFNLWVTGASEQYNHEAFLSRIYDGWQGLYYIG